MAFSILASIVSLHLMNYIGIAAIIEKYKQKRKRAKQNTPTKMKPKEKAPPYFQVTINF
jgi:hypothetical protein